MKIIAMIPARLGSQRLKQKNLQLLNGIPLITHAIRKAKDAKIFDEIWVNSEAEIFGEIASSEQVFFHKRPEIFSSNTATSEDFVYEFLIKHECDYLIQLHSIAPLLTKNDTIIFTNHLIKNELDVLLSIEEIQIECSFNNNPINFNYFGKINSQELIPIQKITWSITGWKSKTYVEAYESKKCATFSGKVGYFKLDKMAAHIIKNQTDLDIAESLIKLVNDRL